MLYQKGIKLCPKPLPIPKKKGRPIKVKGQEIRMEEYKKSHKNKETDKSERKAKKD